MGIQGQAPNDQDLEHTNEPPPDDLAARQARHDVYEWEDEEAEYEAIAPEIEALGPENENPDVIMENLEEFGFDLMDDDEQLSVPSTTRTPGWELEAAMDEPDSDELDDIANDSEGDRPVEDEAIADLDDDLPPEREAPEI